MQRKILLLCLINAVSLTGCMNIATTGAQAIYNRHTIQRNLTDQYISLQAFHALNFNNEEFADTNISVATYNREVLLAGQVPHAWQKHRAEKIVKRIANIKKIYNLVQVSSPSSTLTRMSDAWITAKVKTILISSNDVDASEVKVVTENGTVYLMGILTGEAADEAVALTREVDGVRSVVRIFSYITISKTRSPSHNPIQPKKA